MTEDEFREILGYGGPPEVTFGGKQWEIRPDGLGPLLRYARASHTAGADDDKTPLAALYRLLEDILTDFGGFAVEAFGAKADIEQIVAVSHQAVEFYCARNYWPAMRLIGYVADSLEEMDGNLLRDGGRGLASLTAREACNLALAVCLDGRSEEDRDIFLEDLNYEGNPEAEALALVRQMQADSKAAAGGGDS